MRHILFLLYFQNLLSPPHFGSVLNFKLNFDRQSVGQSVLVAGAHLGPATNSSFCLKFSLDSWRVCCFLAPPLTRERVCNLLYNCFWALSEQSDFGQSPAELTTIFYCIIWDSPNLEVQILVFISNRVAQLYLQALGSLLLPLWSIC
jgi:hypothetical protein